MNTIHTVNTHTHPEDSMTLNKLGMPWGGLLTSLLALAQAPLSAGSIIPPPPNIDQEQHAEWETHRHSHSRAPPARFNLGFHSP